MVLLCGEIEALEKELDREVEDLVMHGVVVELPCKGALEGGGGMVKASDEVLGAAAALICLECPLVL